MVDNIYQNVLNVEVLVEKGKENLEQAEKSQRSARKKKAICFSILFVVILILIEIGAFSYFYSSSGYLPYNLTSTTIFTTTSVSPTTVTNNDGVEWDPNFVPDSKT